MADAEAPLLTVDGAPAEPHHAVRRDVMRMRRSVARALCAGLFGVGVFTEGIRSRYPARGATLAAVAASPKVRVEVYGMAGCPFTRGFVEGPLVEVVKTVPELIDLEFTPFGNSYYPTQACGGSAKGMPYASYNKGYDQGQRQCWDKLCGLGAVDRPGDCFTGELICQHGTTDGMVTSAWACAKVLSQNSSRLYIPFFQCTSIGFLAVTSAETYRELVATCARETGFDAEDVLTCAASHDTLNAQGMLTPAHPAVPYALVDGEVLGDTACVACGDGIINKVCQKNQAKGGPSTPVCDAILR